MELNEADWNDEETANKDNPAWHPEWRIGRVAKDFTDATTLIGVLEAWRKQDVQCRKWRIESDDWKE